MLPQDRALSREKGQPLCMAQYQRLFASYRTPGLEKDQLRSFPPPDENEHIIVAHQGQVCRQKVEFDIDYSFQFLPIVLAFGGAPQRVSIVCRRNGLQLCGHYGVDGRTKEQHISRPAAAAAASVEPSSALPSFGSPNDCQQAALGSMASSITPRYSVVSPSSFFLFCCCIMFPPRTDTPQNKYREPALFIMSTPPLLSTSQAFRRGPAKSNPE